jgi:hypothetical protein
MNLGHTTRFWLIATVLLVGSITGNSASAAFTNRTFDCYVAAYAEENQSRRLIAPSLRVGLHPSGSDPAIHLYGSSLQVIPITDIRRSDRFLRATIVSAEHRSRDLGRLLLRQRGLNLEFNLRADRRGSSEADNNTVFIGECSSVGYQRF